MCEVNTVISHSIYNVLNIYNDIIMKTNNSILFYPLEVLHQQDGTIHFKDGQVELVQSIHQARVSVAISLVVD